MSGLEAHDNGFGAHAVATLAAALTGLPRLSHIGLARNVSSSPSSDPGARAEAAAAFAALAALLTHSGCAVRTLELGGHPTTHAVPSALASLLLAAAACPTLTSLDVSGHGGGGTLAASDALAHLLRNATALRTLSIHRNAFPAAALGRALRVWRRRNLRLRAVSLFARGRGVATISLEHEASFFR